MLTLRLLPVQRQAPKLKQRQQLNCKVCGRHISAEQRLEDAQVIAVVGSVKYAVCCCCDQIVYDADMRERSDSKLFHNHNYRRRWMRYKNKTRLN